MARKVFCLRRLIFVARTRTCHVLGASNIVVLVSSVLNICKHWTTNKIRSSSHAPSCTGAFAQANWHFTTPLNVSHGVCCELRALCLALSGRLGFATVLSDVSALSGAALRACECVHGWDARNARMWVCVYRVQTHATQPRPWQVEIGWCRQSARRLHRWMCDCT